MAQIDPTAQSLAAASDARSRGRLESETIAGIVIFLLCILLIVCARFISPALGGWSHAETTLLLASFLIVVAFGQGLVILVGGLDLSVASMITLGGVLSTTMVGSYDAGAWALPVVVVFCSLLGGVSGFSVAYLKVPPFIMTMAMGVIVYSACLGYTKGSPRGAAPELFIDLMKAEWLGIPVAIIFVLLFALAGWLVQKHTAFGRRLYAVGSNQEAAYVAGVHVRRVTLSAYVVSALCAGFTGMMLAGYANGATLRMGDSYLLPSIAAVVVGGSSILGGRGSFIGTVGGAILLTALSTIIQALGVPQGWRTVIEGMIILIALLMLREQLYQAITQLFSRQH
ncbi:MAG: ABC transporter permease [Kiloniellales bacterium]